MNNLNNANKDFQNIIECDFNKHWSWSILFKNLSILEQINKLPINSSVLEIGAANSYLKKYTRTNLNRGDILFHRIDVNPIYKEEMTIANVVEKIPFYNMDLIIASEIIEHLPSKLLVPKVIERIYNSLAIGGKLVLTTPTPDKSLDDKVWPDDHEYELEFYDIYYILNKYFEIEQTLPWSLKERDFNKLLETNQFAMTMYIKLRGKMPESFIRAIIALFAPDNLSRQTLMICKKRRVPNA